MIKDKIAIICPADFPVPTIKGGAVETLIEIFIKENEKFKCCDIVVYSYFDNKALIESKKYKNVEFVFIKVNRTIDKVNNIIKKLLRKIFEIDINTIFMKKVIKSINKKGIKKIIIEGDKYKVLPIKDSIKSSEIYLHIHHEAFSDNYINNMEIFKACKKIITVSDYIKEKCCENKYINPEKVVTLKNCTDIEIFNKSKYYEKKESIKRKYNIKENEIIILFSGRLLAVKGIKELILAFKKYCLDLNAKMLIVGNAGFGKNIISEYDNELLKIAKEVEDKLIFTGFIHNSEIPLLHSISDIAVVPSIWNDPAPLVVIEAMSSGLPLIVTDSGGIPEYINEECAITIIRDNEIINNLGKALRKLILKEEIRYNMSINARKQGVKFNTKSYYKDFINILKDDRDKIDEN